MASGSKTQWEGVIHSDSLFLFLNSIFLLQGESGASSSSSPAKSSVLSDGSVHSSGSSSSSNPPQGGGAEQVLTQQPCSLKGSFSSDNIYGGLHADGTANQAGPGQGTQCSVLCVLCVCVCVWGTRHIQNISCANVVFVNILRVEASKVSSLHRSLFIFLRR